MARKLIHTEVNANRTVKVYRDSEWNEYRAVLYVDGVKDLNSDAFDDDKESILGTAKAMARPFNFLTSEALA